MSEAGQPRTAEIEGFEKRGVERGGISETLLMRKGIERLLCNAALPRDARRTVQGRRLDVTQPRISRRGAETPSPGAEIREFGASRKLGCGTERTTAHVAFGTGVDGRIVDVGDDRDARVADIFVPPARTGERKAPAVCQAEVGSGLHAAGMRPMPVTAMSL